VGVDAPVFDAPEHPTKGGSPSRASARDRASAHDAGGGW